MPIPYLLLWIFEAVSDHVRPFACGARWRGLYTGVGSSLARDAPFSAVYWGMLESTRSLILRSNLGFPFTRPASSVQSDHTVGLSRQIGPAGTFVASVSAAVMAVILTHPFDVVKTRMQTSNTLLGTSSFQALKHMLEKEGPRVMTQGLSIRLAYLLPATTITVTTYEYVKGLLNEHDRLRQDPA